MQHPSKKLVPMRLAIIRKQAVIIGKLLTILGEEIETATAGPLQVSKALMHQILVLCKL